MSHLIKHVALYGVGYQFYSHLDTRSATLGDIARALHGSMCWTQLVLLGGLQGKCMPAIWAKPVVGCLNRQIRSDCSGMWVKPFKIHTHKKNPVRHYKCLFIQKVRKMVSRVCFEDFFPMGTKFFWSRFLKFV